VTGPDVILVELELAGCDGRDVLRALKKNPLTNRIPVVLLSRPLSHLDRLMVLELGAAQYVERPIDVEMLLRRLERESCTGVVSGR
jgi:chemotaxis family two-component system response regulator PixH